MHTKETSQYKETATHQRPRETQRFLTAEAVGLLGFALSIYEQFMAGIRSGINTGGLTTQPNLQALITYAASFGGEVSNLASVVWTVGFYWKLRKP